MKLVSTIVTAATAVVLAGAALLAQSGSDLLARALVEEKTGSYEQAIVVYQTILDKHWSDKKLAARALFQMGQAYDKLGKADDARKAYERIARELPGQKQIAADARQLLVALTRAASASPHHRPICSDCSNLWSALSADGRMAFDRDDDLFVRDNGTGVVTALLVGNPSDATGWPILSPDGKNIAYVRLWNPDGHDLSIVANEVGAKPRTLNENPQYYRLIPSEWERDGRSILAVAHMADDTWMLARVSTSDGTVTQLRSLGWRFSPYSTNGGSGLGRPRLSPDGRRVAYAALVSDMNPRSPRPTPESKFYDSHIYLLSLDGSTPEVVIVPGASQNESPVWTPDGRHLLFVSNRGGDWGVWSVDVESGALQQIRDIAGRVESVEVTRSWSYVYRRPPGRGDASFAVSALTSTSGVAATRDPETVVGRTPTWSPDSSRIAYLKNEEINNQKFRTLVVRFLDTKNEQRYVLPGIGWQNEGIILSRDDRTGALLGPNEHLWWLNDSSLLVWPGRARVANEIYRVDLRTNQVTPVGTEKWALIALSADRRTLFASLSGDGEAGSAPACEAEPLVAMDLSAGTSRSVASVPRNSSLIASRDGRTLFVRPCSRFERNEGGSVSRHFHRIVALDSMRGEQRDVFVVRESQSIEGVSLSPDARTLAVLVTDLGSQRSRKTLVRVGVDGGENRELHVARLPDGSGAYIGRLSWAANGASIRWCEALSSGGRCRPVEIAADGRGGVREMPTPDEDVRSPDGLKIIRIIPAADRERRDLWAMENVSSLLSRAPR